MRRVLTSVITVGALVVGSACGSNDSAGDPDLPSVVVTTSIAGDMVTAALGDLVGEQLHVEVLVPVGADAHEFAPSAKQAETMENAELLVVVGLGYEEGMADIIDNAIDAGAVVFALAGALEPEDGGDPHVWLDPVLMAEVFGALPMAVAQTTGVPIDDVQRNVGAYISELNDLDETIKNEFNSMSSLHRDLVTNHDSLRRFADRYDLRIVDTIIPSISTSAEASAADLDGVLATVRSGNVSAIFSDSTGSDELAQALADELGRDFEVVELYTESLGEPGSDADTYIAMMTVNAQRIAGALG